VKDDHRKLWASQSHARQTPTSGSLPRSW